MISVISCDTDGIYISEKVDIIKINEYLDKKTKEIFNIDKNYLHMEIDDYDKGFFRNVKGKHYILQDNDKILIHGQSLKGQHMPKFFDTCLNILVKEMFDGKVSKKIDIKSFPISDLIQSIKVKEEGSYKSDGSLSMQLIQAAKRELPDIKLKDNDQLSYIKTNKGYELIVPGKKYGDIDYKYYQNILDKIYERLNIEDKKQLTFGDF